MIWCSGFVIVSRAKIFIDSLLYKMSTLFYDDFFFFLSFLSGKRFARSLKRWDKRLRFVRSSDRLCFGRFLFYVYFFLSILAVLDLFFSFLLFLFFLANSSSVLRIILLNFCFSYLFSSIPPPPYTCFLRLFLLLFRPTPFFLFFFFRFLQFPFA